MTSDVQVPGFEDEKTEAPKKGKVAEKPKAEDGKKSPDVSKGPGHHKNIGFITKSGILHAIGKKFPWGHISWMGNVVLSKCPKCKNENMSPNEAVKGLCDKCGFNAVEHLEEQKA